MYKTLFEGFDTLKISERIEIPPLAELLSVTTMHRADMDDAYKYGGPIIRDLIDKSPLANDKKNYTVRVQMQYLKKGWFPVTTTEWHLDGFDGGRELHTYYSDDRVHIFVGECSNLFTEFLAEPVIAEELFDVSNLGVREIRSYLENNQYKLGFQPKYIEPNKFVTMTSRHAHRVRTAPQDEFRFFFEARESDYDNAVPWSQARRRQQFAWKTNYGEPKVCMEQTEQWGLIIRDRYDVL